MKQAMTNYLQILFINFQSLGGIDLWAPATKADDIHWLSMTVELVCKPEPRIPYQAEGYSWKPSKKVPKLSLDWLFSRHSDSKILMSEKISKRIFFAFQNKNLGSENRKSTSFSLLEHGYDLKEIPGSIKVSRKTESLI